MAALLAVFHALPRVCGFVCGVAALHWLLPAWHTTGYACASDGAPLRYRLNGLLVLIATAAGWAALQPHHASDAAVHWWAYWAAAHVVGLGASAAVFAMTWSDRELPLRSLTSDQKQLCERAARGENVQSLLPPAPHRSLAAHFFFGFKFNPRLGQVDLKMLCYTIGACGLLWNLLSGAALRLSMHGSLSLAFWTYGSLVAQSWPEALLPWAYPIYYVAILIPRQHDDDDLLRCKYGDAVFRLYSEAVPYRIVPGVW
ncbi:hypothetical protein AB1Y20_003448 [Prymnesium parvum]|uniref:Polyprenol reductase n=1 Tax=Prymnesium parvum TaxID=97485 RepID=A0AB34JE35_PRYPA